MLDIAFRLCLCKEIEFDKEKLDSYIFEEIKYKFDNDETLFDEGLHSQIQDDLEKMDKSLKELEAYIRKLSIKARNWNVKYKDFLDNLIIFLIEANSFQCNEQACMFLFQDELIGFEDFDDFIKPKESLMQTLYIINEGAKQIMKVKNEKSR